MLAPHFSAFSILSYLTLLTLFNARTLGLAWRVLVARIQRRHAGRESWWRAVTAMSGSMLGMGPWADAELVDVVTVRVDKIVEQFVEKRYCVNLPRPFK